MSPSRRHDYCKPWRAPGLSANRAERGRTRLGAVLRPFASVLVGILVATAGTPATAQGLPDWIKRAFNDSPSPRPTSAVRRSSDEPKDLHDLRTGSLPLRSEQMLKYLDLAYGRFKAIAQRGGWPQIPTNRMIRPGDDDERVPIVRRRLLATGELRSSNTYQTFNYDGELEVAVRRFQTNYGLAINGRIDRSTIAAMNVPVQARLAQIKQNYERIAALLDNFPREPRYIFVNVPAYQVEAVENGQVVHRYRAITGRPGRDTPKVRAEVRALNFFPYWRVPSSIATLDVAPRLIKEPGYLAKEQIRVLKDSFNGPEIDASTIDWSRFDPKTMKLRQDPGPQNALGLVRLDMPNEHGVYMHDTPMKALFNRPQRDFSAGCVRIQGVFDLAAWVANGDQGVDRQRINDILQAGQPVDIKLTHPVPVYFAYITAWADKEGIPSFRPDIYGRDGLAELNSDREKDPDAPPPPPQGFAP
ncbi:MAG: murein L,D-transpeptidase [Hyphomicrobiaceae bacterium]